MTPDEAIKILELNLHEEADEESLKKQYKKMVLKWHPDRNKDPGANAKFIKITEAYDTLTKYIAQRNLSKNWFGDSVTITFHMNDGTMTTTDSSNHFYGYYQGSSV